MRYKKRKKFKDMEGVIVSKCENCNAPIKYGDEIFYDSNFNIYCDKECFLGYIKDDYEIKVADKELTCSQCKKNIVIGENYIVGYNLNFCSEECLIEYCEGETVVLDDRRSYLYEDDEE